MTGGSAFADKTTVEIGKSVMLVASPAQNYIFVKWIIYNSDGNELVTSTDNPFTYTPGGNIISDSVLVQIVKYIGSNLVGSGASVLSYSEAINKISPTITAY